MPLGNLLYEMIQKQLYWPMQIHWVDAQVLAAVESVSVSLDSDLHKLICHRCSSCDTCTVYRW